MSDDDDDSLGEDAKFLRRVHPHWLKDGRPDSSNFKKRSDEEGLSVTLWESEADLLATKSEAPTFGIVCVTAGQLRAAGYKIRRSPIEGNDNHCECIGKPSGGQRKALAAGSDWVQPPPET